MTSQILDFTQIYNLLYKKVFYFVYFKIQDEEVVKDLVQETFLSAYRTWKKIPEDIDTARNFLFIIAKSRMIDYFRSANTRYVVHPYDDEENSFFEQITSQEKLPEESVEENSRKQVLLEILNSLNESDKTILVLRYLQDMSYKDISTLFETSESTIRKKVERALKKAQKYIDEKNINI